MYVTGAPYRARGFELPSAYAPKGSGLLTQMERTQAAVFLNSEQNGDQVEGVYQQLSDQSKDVLSKLKDGGQVEKDAWKGLCKELLDLDYRLIPLGCPGLFPLYGIYGFTPGAGRAVLEVLRAAVALHRPGDEKKHPAAVPPVCAVL